jgi:hypothetical protein
MLPVRTHSTETPRGSRSVRPRIWATACRPMGCPMLTIGRLRMALCASASTPCDAHSVLSRSTASFVTWGPMSGFVPSIPATSWASSSAYLRSPRGAPFKGLPTTSALLPFPEGRRCRRGSMPRAGSVTKGGASPARRAPTGLRAVGGRPARRRLLKRPAAFQAGQFLHHAPPKLIRGR